MACRYAKFICGFVEMTCGLESILELRWISDKRKDSGDKEKISSSLSFII